MTIDEVIEAFEQSSKFQQSGVTVKRPRGITVLIPVYGAREYVFGCLASIAVSRQACNVQFNVLVVDDCGPDPELSRELRLLAEAGFITLVKNPENLGFPGACNNGFSKAPDDDILVLNSDTQVFGNWLDRIIAVADADSTIGTITPLTNDGEISSYPIWLQHNSDQLFDAQQIDQAAAIANASCMVDAPTGVGFCMYISRELLNRVGGFDEAAFGKGYGEENDLCQRALRSGLRNVILPSVYVVHVGSRSFGDTKSQHTHNALEVVEARNPGYSRSVADFISTDPLALFRREIDKQLLSTSYPNGSVLLLTHGRGGGTWRAVLEAADRWEKIGVCAIVARPVKPGASEFYLNHATSDFGTNLGTFDFGVETETFSEIASSLRIRTFEVHHWIDFSSDFTDVLRIRLAQLGIEYRVILHDYSVICPRVHLTDDSNRYCGVPGLNACQRCIGLMSNKSGEATPSIFGWLEQSKRFLNGAQSVSVPSLDTANLIHRRLTDVPLQIEPNWRAATELTIVGRKQSQGSTGNYNVVVIGAISEIKGAEILEEVVRLASISGSPLHFTVIGMTSRDKQLSSYANVRITGKYDDNELDNLIESAQPKLIWVPGAIHETFSYTLSESLARTDVPIVCYDFGVVGERVLKGRRGWILPKTTALLPAETLQQLETFCSQDACDFLTKA